MTTPAHSQHRLQLRTGERRLLLVMGDLVAAALAMVLALALWGRLDYLGATSDFVRYRAGWFPFIPLVWPLFLLNLYDVHRAASWRETLRGVPLAAATSVMTYMVIYFLLEGSLYRRAILYFLVLAILLTLLWRLLYIRVLTAPAFLRRVLIVGAGEAGRTILFLIRGLRTAPFNVVGLIDDDPAKAGAIVEGVRVIGDNTSLLRIIEESGISDVIVAISGEISGAMFQTLLDAQEKGAEIVRMPVVYEELTGRVPIRHLETDWMLRSFVDEVRVSSFYLLAKRTIDILGSFLGLFALFALLPWIALAILVESGRPIFFSQSRLGQGGRTYTVVKLRTMRQDAESDGRAHWAMAEDPRTTRLGRLLRRAHIDELPQFWNVLRGEMSIVGPRPERPELVRELERQIPFYRARLLVKPGISGWAQVNYGKGASVEGSAEKLEYDLYYIKHRSLWLDLSIILRTIGSVVGFRGV
jgi:exopolysaccharide biosynthesis polyprenyl glycosylphosphotransferase